MVTSVPPNGRVTRARNGLLLCHVAAEMALEWGRHLEAGSLHQPFQLAVQSKLTTPPEGAPPPSMESLPAGQRHLSLVPTHAPAVEGFKRSVDELPIEVGAYSWRRQDSGCREMPCRCYRWFSVDSESRIELKRPSHGEAT